MYATDVETLYGIYNMCIEDKDKELTGWISKVEYSINVLLSPLIIAFFIIFIKYVDVAIGFRGLTREFYMKFFVEFLTKIVAFGFVVPLLAMIVYSYKAKRKLHEVITFDDNAWFFPTIVTFVSYIILLYSFKSEGIVVFILLDSVITLIGAYLIYFAVNLSMKILRTEIVVSVHSTVVTTLAGIAVFTNSMKLGNMLAMLAVYLILIALVYTVRLELKKDSIYSLLLGSIVGVLSVVPYALIVKNIL